MANAAISRAGFGDRTGSLPPATLIFGRSTSMQTARQKIDKVAQSGVPILIQGDNGTGKGLLASFIHSLSPIPGAPFVKVNCAAIPGSLLESELFGYEKGAFTGAHSSKPGRVELANGGTLFLDGIDEIDMSLQAKLLQLLQDGQFCRIGGQEDRRVQVRAICATNRRLEVGNRERTVSTGFILPDQRRERRSAAAAIPARGYSRFGGLFPAASQGAA